MSKRDAFHTMTLRSQLVGTLYLENTQGNLARFPDFTKYLQYIHTVKVMCVMHFAKTHLCEQSHSQWKSILPIRELYEGVKQYIDLFQGTKCSLYECRGQ